jgi:Fe-S-cluster containining protein
MYVHGGRSDDPNQIGKPMSFEQAEHVAMKNGLPFRPLDQDEKGTWRYWCLNLLPNGRCGDYENRPGLCRLYVAGSDGLCVHHWENPRGEEDREPPPATHQESAA